MNRSHAAVAAVVGVVLTAGAGLALLLSSGDPAPTQPAGEIPAAEVVVSTTASSAAPEPAPVAVASEEVVAPAPAPTPVAAKPPVVKKAPAVVATVQDEPAEPAPTLGPGETSPAPPPPNCRWVYDGPDDHIGHEVCA